MFIRSHLRCFGNAIDGNAVQLEKGKLVLKAQMIIPKHSIQFMKISRVYNIAVCKLVEMLLVEKLTIIL